MKPLIYNIVCMLLFTTMAFANTSPGAADFDKVIEKEFSISSDGTLEIDSKFGEVNIETWNQNKIGFRVIIEVDAPSQEKANNVFDKIDIEFDNSTNRVSAKTKFSNKMNFGKKVSYQVNYEVKMPSSVHLELEHSYGNADIPRLSNGANLNVSFGNINIETIEGNSTIDLNYGNMEFDKLGDVEAEIKFSNVGGDVAGNTEIKSQYSQISIERAGDVSSESNSDVYKFDKIGNFSNKGSYDQIKINSVEDFTIDTKFSDSKIDNLNGNINVNQTYGTVKVDDFSCAAGTNKLDLEFVDFKLDLSGCDNYEINANASLGALEGPDGSDVESSNYGQKKKLYVKKGSGAAKFEASLNYGSLKIKLKASH